MPCEIQEDLIMELCLSQLPKQSQRFRPHQQTIPMGFTWAVHIAHNLAAELMMKTLDFTLYGHDPGLRIINLSRHNRSIELRAYSALVLHIIDDTNFCFIDVSNDTALRIQLSVWSALNRIRLPQAIQVHTLETIEEDILPFIGYH